MSKMMRLRNKKKKRLSHPLQRKRRRLLPQPRSLLRLIRSKMI